MNAQSEYKVWIEISRAAILKNIRTFQNILPAQTELWSVVKSNAYGHGLFTFVQVAADAGVQGFCVDSVIEAEKLRAQRITKPILVLGPTLPSLFPRAARQHITLSVANETSLEELTKIEDPLDKPEVHLKIDTGMNRQGFFIEDLKRVLKIVKKHDIKLRGIFSHFASAKDITYPTYTKLQFEKFQKASALCEQEGFTHIKRHIAATGGTMLSPEHYLDIVRIGIGLYGIYPSRELAMQLPQFELHPVLSWHTVISEVKKIKKGAYVGYDLTERVTRDTVLAILPIGYWHGLPWSLASRGQVLINGKRANILGRVSMDITVVDVTDIRCVPGDGVTLIGKNGKDEITARELAERANTTPYEIVTRLNPLIKRIAVD